MHLIMADQGGSGGISVMRDYRKGNWTVSETMVLIEAKKMDDERRMKRGGESSEAGSSSKPTELRWKWVEDYCWRKGCLRSQNQCNDKWDNLMRAYKKVRDYERIIAERSEGGHGNTTVSVEGSYWKLEKNERKEKNLPSSMLPQIYQALVEVVEKKEIHHKIVSVGANVVGGGSSASDPNIGHFVQPSLPSLLQHQYQVSCSIPLLPVLPPLPPPPHQPPIAQTAAPLSYHPHQSLPTVDSDTSEYSDSPAKRRRRGRGRGGSDGREGTSGTANTSSSSHEVGSAICKSASIIAEALQASEERQERRHRDLLSLHERRLKIEESKTEIKRQGVNGLVDAVNKLANSILSLASNSKNQSSSE